MSAPADAGKNIAPAPASGRISIIPMVIIGGLVLSAAGGFYIWREISTPPMLQKQDVATLAAPAVPLPASAPVVTQELPPTEKTPVSPDHPGSNSKRKTPAPTPASGVLSATVTAIESAIAPAPPIRIEHARGSGAVNPVLLAAWQAYRSGDFDTALQYYSEVLHKDAQEHSSPNRDALLGMAAIAQQRSQDDIAAQYYKQLLALDPRDPDAYAGMSSLPGAAADTESALKLLLAQRPAAALHFALGNHYAKQSRWGDAQQAYFSACALEPDNARFAFNLAVSLDHLGRDKLAAQHYRRALQLDSAGNTGFDRAQTQLRLNELTLP